MGTLFLTREQGLRRETLALVYRTMKGPRLIRNPPGSSYIFQPMGLDESCEGIPGCQVSVQNSDSEVCHYRNTAPYFSPLTEQNKNIIPWFPTSFTQLPLLMFTQLNLFGFQRESYM